jgi:uncharacterized protein (TIGR04255 family)
MNGERYSHPPIVEALVEIKWNLQKSIGAMPIDPHYPLLLGSFYQQIKDKYPFYEALPTATIPDFVAGAVVKHRFRVEKNKWPLVQIGPGIMSVNITAEYETFKQFKPLAIDAMKNLFAAHPQKNELKINSLLLRYIDAYEIDYSKENICDFIARNMHISMNLPEFLLQKGRLEKIPTGFKWQTSFRCNNPEGMANLDFFTGTKDEKPALIWDQMLHSIDDDIDNMPDKFETWLDSAHEVIHTWFEDLIQGKLKEEFQK